MKMNCSKNKRLNISLRIKILKFSQRVVDIYLTLLPIYDKSFFTPVHRLYSIFY
jgi:hypothetical protein